MEDCVITTITKDAMIAALDDEPKFSALFMAYLLTQNSRIEEDLIDQLSIRARSGLPACCCCWRTSGRTASRSRSVRTQSGNAG